MFKWTRGSPFVVKGRLQNLGAAYLFWGISIPEANVGGMVFLICGYKACADWASSKPFWVPNQTWHLREPFSICHPHTRVPLETVGHSELLILQSSCGEEDKMMQLDNPPVPPWNAPSFWPFLAISAPTWQIHNLSQLEQKVQLSFVGFKTWQYPREKIRYSGSCHYPSVGSFR